MSWPPYTLVMSGEVERELAVDTRIALIEPSSPGASRH